MCFFFFEPRRLGTNLKPLCTISKLELTIGSGRKLGEPLNSSLTLAENAFVGWPLNFRVRVLLKRAVIQLSLASSNIHGCLQIKKQKKNKKRKKKIKIFGNVILSFCAVKALLNFTRPLCFKSFFSQFLYHHSWYHNMLSVGKWLLLRYRRSCVPNAEICCGTDLKLIMKCFDLNFNRLLSENRLQEIPDQAFKTLTELKIL